MKILVTGASGFIGSYIVSEGLEKGHEMWAGMRGSSSKQYLQDERIRFAELNLGNPALLLQQLEACKVEMGGKGWDYVVHAAGATKSLTREGFFRTNTDGTRHLIEALRKADMMPERFVFISSLSVFGAIRETQPYEPIRLTDTPVPNTAYGASKLAAEAFVKEQKDLNWVILRPTGVYGPREKDYFLMAQSIQQHVDFAVGYQQQDITFVYVMDVVQAVFKACERAEAVHGAFFLSDGAVYDSRRFSDLLQAEMGTKWVLHLKAPVWVLWLICMVNGSICGWLKKLTTLNKDKYNILKQRNWQCDIAPAREVLGYEPAWDLARGVAASVKWYQEAGWLK